MSGSTTFSDCPFYQNSAQDGGAMYTDATCSVSLDNVTLAGNQAKSFGGAILVADGANVSIYRSSFTDNGRFCADEFAQARGEKKH
jgi:predicted outer membrane repeat protein